MKNPSHPITQVLVIEDDSELLKVLCESISQAGYAVSEAADGLQASAILRAKSFGLVITDLYMPKRDGFEVIMELHQSRPRTKIIAISGHPTRQNMLPAAAWLAASLENKEIASELGVSGPLAAKIIRSVFLKLGVHRRMEAILRWKSLK